MHRPSAAGIVLAVLLAACGGSGGSADTTLAVTTTARAATTTEAPATTEAPTTSEAPTTTTLPPVVGAESVDRLTLAYELAPSGFRVDDVEFSPDGTMLAASNSNNVDVFDTATGETIVTLGPNPGNTTQLAWSPDGSRIAVVAQGTDQAVLWDVATGEQLFTLDHIGASGLLSLGGWNEDGGTVATAGGTSIRFWDAATGEIAERITTASEYTMAMAWSPDGSQLAVGSTTIEVFNAGEWDSGVELTDPYVSDPSWSPDGAMLAALEGPFFVTYVLYDAETLEIVRTLGCSGFPQDWEAPCDTGPNERLGPPSWSPDGAVIVGYSWDESMAFVWDPASGNLLATINLVEGSTYWAADGTTLLLTSVGGAPIAFWDPITGQQAGELATGPDAVIDLAISPDGTKLASGDSGGFVRIWSLDS